MPNEETEFEKGLKLAHDKEHDIMVAQRKEFEERRGNETLDEQ